MNPSFLNKVAILTGAGGGIGEAIALRLDALGYKLLLCDIQKQKLEILSAKLKTKPDFYIFDLTDPEQVEVNAKKILNDHPKIDVLVNNAGYAKEGAFLSLDISEIYRHFEINLLSGLRLMHTIAPRMVEQREGAIVCIVSMGAITALADSALYSSAKFGLRGFLTAFHEELKKTGVKVSGVYPAAVDTPMLLHEAMHGGSVLNWLSDVQSPDAVAKAVLKGIQKGTMEIYVPYGEGLLARVTAVFPWFVGFLSPILLWLGERGRRKWLKAKGIDPISFSPIAK
ncbi:SDR family NAD(P)-dependent oxidoreductase [Leptospira sp. 96542]|nr:SDR family NAD(P)-dependent oxidoreductase [Leptospira sp. 96542]